MVKGKDFYGTEIAEVIEQACKELGLPREQLDIAVLETGSAGIFGLCKKKAHIRVQVKKSASQADSSPKGLEENKSSATPPESSAQAERPRAKRQSAAREPRPRSSKKAASGSGTTSETEQSGPAPAATPASDSGMPGGATVDNETGPIVAQIEERLENAAPTAESLGIIEDKLTQLLVLMGLPSAVRVEYADSTILCNISGEHEEYLAGQDGKILDSLQYLLRKMIGPNLPERATLSLDAAGYREQRLERLKQQAGEIAEQVRQSGKTRTISGLNPSERRAIHLVLQQDDEIRSRSVGSGLFKKILIYKPGKEGRSSAPAKTQDSSDGRQNND